jgi:lipoic acid synthetase
VPPEEFAEIEAEARRLGFSAVASGPFVRSSYNAQAVFESI